MVGVNVTGAEVIKFVITWTVKIPPVEGTATVGMLMKVKLPFTLSGGVNPKVATSCCTSARVQSAMPANCPVK